MFTASDFRRQAWNSLKGKWGTAALCWLIVVLITGACAALSFFVVGGVAQLLLTGPFTLGMAGLSLRVIRGFPISVEQVFEGFRDFVRALVAYLLISIFTFLWSLLFIIPGLIKAISYSMTYFILLDRPDLSANEARKLSMALMEGHKWRYFCLMLSFLGWMLLCALTFGILSFWVIPYMEAACAAFYQDLLWRQTAQTQNIQGGAPGSWSGN